MQAVLAFNFLDKGALSFSPLNIVKQKQSRPKQASRDTLLICCFGARTTVARLGPTEILTA